MIAAITIAVYLILMIGCWTLHSHWPTTFGHLVDADRCVVDVDRSLRFWAAFVVRVRGAVKMVMPLNLANNSIRIPNNHL